MTESSLPGVGLRPLGEILLEAGAVSERGLAEALEYKKRKGLKLGQALIDLRLVDEERLASALKQQGRLYCVELRPEIVDPRVAQELDHAFSRERRCIAINRIAGITTVAMEDPADADTLDEIARRLESRVLAVYADPTRIDECVDVAYGVRLEADDDLASILDASSTDELRFRQDTGDAEHFTEEEGVDGPVINLIHALLKEAIESRATAIHLEPRDRRFVVRFRMDGGLHDRLTLERGWARPCIARVKLMCELDVAWRELPQEGEARLVFRGEEVRIRAATAPTVHGEAAVLRLSPSSARHRALGELGLAAHEEELARKMIAGRGGLVLATGSVGSGRRTTLHALLSELEEPHKKLVCIEQHVGPPLAGATQLALDPDAGFTHAEALRAALQQDPDVLLLDDLPDAETAALAVRAAVDGRMILAALAAPGPGEALARIASFGVERCLLADALRGVIAQCLVRRPCQSCLRPDEGATELLEHFGLSSEGATFVRGTGCRECHFSGYRGRSALFELAPCGSSLGAALRSGEGPDGLRRAAIQAGMRTLRELGLALAANGETSLPEVLATSAREAT